MEEIKQKCSYCKEEKLLCEFSRGTNKNGKRSWCKSCINSYYQRPEIKKREIIRLKNRYETIGRQESRNVKRADIRKYLYTNAKTRAKERKQEFSIDLEDIIVPRICPFLGLEMQYNEGIKQDNSYSLDRIDSSKGYIKGNIQVISLRANRIKNDSTIEELEMILNNWKKLQK